MFDKNSPPKLQPLKAKRDEVSKALQFLSTEQLVVKDISVDENTEGYRWDLYRGEIPFWVDLIRFSGAIDLLVVYSIMFQMPDDWDEKSKAELYKYLLELGDFSRSWDTKFFLKENTILLCASRSGEEITSMTARYLVDTFTRFAGVLSANIAEKFPDLVRFIINKDYPGGKEIETDVKK